jgi:hypothetical protein
MDSSLTWKVSGAAVAGSSHVSKGEGCDDAFTYDYVGLDVVVCAMADGAGSATSGGRGAEIAVRTTVAYLRDRLGSSPTAEWDAAIKEAFQQALLAVENEAGTAEDVRRFATTLQVAAVAPNLCGYGRIGDGGCVLVSGSDITSMAPRPENIYVNETEFVTTPAAVPVVSIYQGRVDGLALFTDGLQAVAMNLRDWLPHSLFFRPLFEFVQATERVEASTALREFLSSPRINARTDDDRGLLICVNSCAVESHPS